MQKQGWLQDPKTKNTKRFHRDEKSWFRYPKVFIDSGRPLQNEHALLKSRCYVGLREAEEEWMKLPYGINRLKGLINFMNAEDWSERLPETAEWVFKVAENRGLNYFETFPHLEWLEWYK